MTDVKDQEQPRFVLIRPNDYHDQLDLMSRFHALYGLDRLAWAGPDMMMTEDQAKRLLAHEWPNP